MTDEGFFIALNQKLLDSIASGDFETYRSLTAENVTCFEPESIGHLVEGQSFHKFFFDLPPSQPKAPPATVTMSGVHVRPLGQDVAVVVSYVRINQSYKLDKEGTALDGPPQITKSCETRIWEKINGQWKNVHMHRS